MESTHGRSCALFAFLAGFAVVLVTGRGTPRTGRAGRQAVARVTIRADPRFYCVYFLLVLPLHRLSAGPLAATAAGTVSHAARWNG